jgi:DmsE family decaheme c-type cytochrome
MVWRRVITAILPGLALLFGLQAVAGQEPQESAYAGMDTCEICHEDVVKAFKQSPHWAAVRLGMPSGDGVGCESCHGPGEAHVQDAPEHIITFRDETPGERIAQCASCHEGRSGMSFRRGIHVLAGQACDVCHVSGHGTSTASAPRLLKEDEPDLCSDCHARQAVEMTMPFRHRTSDGVLKCSDCHGVHGKSVRRMEKHAAQEACEDCHRGKQGPFMFEHLANTVTGCVTCHVPHGSTNPKLLIRNQVSFLCLECHSVITRYHDLSQTRFQNCTVCHTAIHGSQVNSLFLR